MSLEAELPGMRLTREALQIICFRYHIVSKFVGGKQVLEVGCGGGLGLRYLCRSASRVVGGDLSTENIECARKNNGGKAELIVLDAHQLPFRNKSFDVVAAMQIIFYLDADTFLEECNRVLKKAGTLIIELPNKDRPYFRPSRRSRNYFSAPELFALLAKHRFGAEIFGAFPVPQSPVWSAWQRARIMAGKVLSPIPQGKHLKALLVDLISNARAVLKEDIGEDADSNIVESMELVSIPSNVSNCNYQILYAIARPKDENENQ